MFTTAADLHALSNLYNDSDGDAATPVKLGPNAKVAAIVKSQLSQPQLFRLRRKKLTRPGKRERG